MLACTDAEHETYSRQMPALLMSKAKLLVLALGTWWMEDHVLESQDSMKTIARSSVRWRGRTFRFSLHDPAPWGHTVLPDCACTSFRSAPLWRRVGESSSCPIRRPSRTSPSGQASRQSIPRSMGRVSADMTNRPLRRVDKMHGCCVGALLQASALAMDCERDGIRADTRKTISLSQIYRRALVVPLCRVSAPCPSTDDHPRLHRVAPHHQSHWLSHPRRLPWICRQPVPPVQRSLDL